MKRALLLALFLCSSAAHAQLLGVDVQVNEGKVIPTLGQLQMVLRPNDLVRDVLGWHRVDRQCDLASLPSKQIAIPSANSTLYETVLAAGGKNFVTLAFNNPACGQISPSGDKAFPDTDALRAEFAAFAVAVVKQVPALGGISIWNELNGSYSGGYRGRADKLTAYCQLANAVIREVRKIDRDLPIAIGAHVGRNIDEWFIAMFDTYGCLGKGDAKIWLDVHPYLTGKVRAGLSDWDEWAAGLAKIRSDGISNPLAATEWGAVAAHRWSLANPTGNYVETFAQQMRVGKPGWAALMWFELLYDKNFPNAGLLVQGGTDLSQFGQQYVNRFVP